jgi:hypothetical protein
MKKLFVIIAVITMVLATTGVALADDDCLHNGPNGSLNGPGPAPNSGDGIPDGPGW